MNIQVLPNQVLPCGRKGPEIADHWVEEVCKQYRSLSPSGKRGTISESGFQIHSHEGVPECLVGDCGQGAFQIFNVISIVS